MRQLLKSSVALGIIVALCGLVMAQLLWAETPHGRVTGLLQTAEAGAALADIEVSLVYATKPTKYRGKTDERGRFTFPHVRVGTYTLVADTRAHRQPTETISVRPGRTTRAVFELQPTDPFLRVFQNQQVFTTDEQVRLRCHGFVPVGELTVSLYRIAGRVAISRWQGWLPDALSTRGRELSNANLGEVPELKRAETRQLTINMRKDQDAEGVFRKEIKLGAQSPGMYLIAVEAGRLRSLAVVTVTDLGLLVKAAQGELLAYAVNIKDNAPAAGAQIAVRRGTGEVAGGTAGKDGLLSLRLPRFSEFSELEVVGRAGESLAVATLYVSGEREEGALRAYTYTDRPVYRPGHHVYFKSLLRELDGDQYRVPPRQEVGVRVTDWRDDVVYSGRHTTTAYGSLSGEFALSESALPGSYTIELSAGGITQDAYFTVAEYRKPEFEVSVTTARHRYVRGETIDAVISAEYYYGAPAPRAQVKYYVTRQQSWYYGEDNAWDEDLTERGGDEDRADGYDYAEGEIVATGEGRTDEQGRLKIAVPSRRKGEKAAEEDGDWQYTIHATITDASRRSETGAAGVLVTQGEFRLVVASDDWVARPGQSVTVTIRTVDYAGNPVPRASGEAVLARYTWEGAREREHVAARSRWRADDEGRASVSVTPDRDGDYRVRVRTADSRGNRITARVWLWVMHEAYASFNYPYQDLDVRADKKLYREGEETRIVVNTRHAPVTALLTIEGQSLLEKRLVRLKGKSSILTVKVRPEFLPAVRARVSFFKGKDLVSGEAAINVSRENKALKVEVASEKRVYQPGERAVYRVKTTTPEGKPVQAEVSLGVVDEAIYAIAPESAENIIAFFYPKRWPEVATAFSFPQVHLSADDKAGSTIRTRRYFPDTAFWAPATVTDSAGEAAFDVTMPDNLTTWRTTCRAASLETRVGQGTTKTVVQKPFLVRLEAPRFFIEGDEVRLAAVLHNLTGRAVTARVGLEVDGFALRDKGAVNSRVGAGQTRRVEWTARVARAGNVRARAWADAGALQDAMELKLPAFHKGRETQVTRSGVVSSREAFRLEINENLIPGTQKLTLRLTPSLASSMLGSLEYLARYPYGCVEQTMSAFLPDVVIMQMLNRLGVRNPRLQKELPKMVESGLLKLYGFQHDDGSWGWWKYDQGAPWMTAYVVFGLLQARDAGFTVNPRVLGSGVAALERMAGERSLADPETRIYAAHVLALAGRPGMAAAVTQEYADPQGGGRVDALSDWGRARLALVMSRAGRPDDGRAVLERVWDHFGVKGYFPRVGARWWADSEYASALLYAACELTPDDQRLPELARWLVERRRGDHWFSTRDTAFALYALSSYLLITRELTPDMQTVVRVNDRETARAHFTAADLFQKEFEVTLGADELGSDHASVVIEKSGPGRLYYTASLEQMVNLDLSTPPLSGSGLVVERSYRKVRAGGPGMRPGEAVPAAGSRFTFDSGDAIEVTLTVRARQHFEYLLVEDPLPAGCEARDRGPMEFWEWDSWWCDQIVRDEMVGFAIRTLEPGARRLVYRMYAQAPGRYTALPPRVYDMYNPAVRGEGVASTVVVRP